MKTSSIQVTTIYWPGWQAMIDGKPVPFSYNNAQGVMMISVPEGKHEVKFLFRESSIRLFADTVSVLAFLCLILFSKRYPLRK